MELRSAKIRAAERKGRQISPSVGMAPGAWHVTAGGQRRAYGAEGVSYSVWLRIPTDRVYIITQGSTQ